jgi:hypothetical protein
LEATGADGNTGVTGQMHRRFQLDSLENADHWKPQEQTRIQESQDRCIGDSSWTVWRRQTTGSHRSKREYRSHRTDA